MLQWWGSRGKIDASQDIVAMLSADSVGNMIVDQILADPVVTEATKQIEKNIEKRNNSIPYKLKQLFSSVVGIATIVASVCMCCAFMLLLLVAGGGGNNTSN